MQKKNFYYLIQGDCLKVLPTLKDKSIDLVVTDPPYFMKLDSFKISNFKRKGEKYKTFRRSLSDMSILEHFFASLFSELERVIKKTGVFYIFCDGQTYPLFWYYLFPFTKSVRPIVWDKKRSIIGYSWRHQHELIIFAEMLHAPKIKTGDGDIIRELAVPLDARLHPAEKPEKLIKKLIMKSSKWGDVILDPFLGSGTTMKVCQDLGRSCIGIEINPEYCEVIKKRCFGKEFSDREVEYKFEIHTGETK